MSTWTDQQKYEGQTPITYNEAAKTYNELSILYSGKQGTVWTDQAKN